MRLQCCTAGTALVAALLAGPASAQVAQERVDLAAVQRIRAEGLDRSRIDDLAQHLLGVIGPRLTGSPAMKQANRWAAATLMQPPTRRRPQQQGPSNFAGMRAALHVPVELAVLLDGHHQRGRRNRLVEAGRPKCCTFSCRPCGSDPIEYSIRTHQSNVDTYDHLLIDDLKQGAVVVASTVYALAMRDDMMPRKPTQSSTTTSSN